MVGFQNRFFSFQPHVHILRRYRHSRLSEGAVQSQAVVFSAQALVCLSAKSWRFVSFGRSFNFQLLRKSPSLIPTEKRQVATLFQKYFAVCKNLLTCSRWERGGRVILKKITSARKQMQKSRTNPCGSIFKNSPYIFIFSAFNIALTIFTVEFPNSFVI